MCRKKGLRLDEQGAPVFAASCFAPRLDPLTGEVSSPPGESGPLRSSRVVSVWRHPCEVVDAEAGVELEGCVSRAVLGHRLLSRMVWLFVQQKKNDFWLNFKSGDCLLPSYAHSPPLPAVSTVRFSFPLVLLLTAQQLLHLIPEAVVGSKQSDLHITSILLVSVHYEAQPMVIRCFAFNLRSPWSNVPVFRHRHYSRAMYWSYSAAPPQGTRLVMLDAGITDD